MREETARYNRTMEQALRLCDGCGAPLRQGARFCPRCGARAAIRDLTARDEETRLASDSMRPPRTLFATNYAPPAPAQTPYANSFDAARSESSDEDERVIFSERPVGMFVWFAYAVAAFFALCLAFLLAFVSAGRISAGACALFSLALLVFPAYFHLRRNSLRYTLTDSKIEIARGILRRTTRSVPLRNVHNVTVSASLLQRLFNYGNILIDDMTGQRSATLLHNIRAPHRRAEDILRAQRRWR